METLKKLKWEPSMSTGVDEIDAQHKYLFDTFNRLGDAIAMGPRKENILTILNRLSFYVKWHFGKEEEYMYKYSCPASDINKKNHEDFARKFDQFYTEYKDSGGTLELAEKIHGMLSDWLVKHIMAVDVQLMASVREKADPNYTP